MSITARFAPNEGFHPTLDLTVTKTVSPGPECRLFTLISIPPAFIVDRYQLYQLQSEGKLSTRDGIVEVLGESDLEGPVWKARDAALLVQLVEEDATPGNDEVRVRVPLHLRYQYPTRKIPRSKSPESRPVDRIEVSMNQPRAFWACPTHALAPANDVPFTRCPPPSSLSRFNFTSLRESTVYSFLEGSNLSSCPFVVDDLDRSSSRLSVTLPTGLESHSRFVGPTTVSIVWLGFFYLVWVAFGVRSSQSRRRDEVIETSKGFAELELEKKQK